MEKYGFVYLWYDRKHKRYYIGCHWGTVTDGYICSSNWMKQGYKHRPEDFSRRILKIVNTNKSELLDEEYKWLSLIKKEELGKRYYNLQNEKFGHWSINGNDSLSIKEKLSTAAIRLHQDPKYRKKFLEGRKKMPPQTQEQIAKRALSNTGQKRTEETKRKIGESNSGEKHYMFGKKIPEDTKEKIRRELTGEKNPFYGKKHPPELQKHISEKTRKKLKGIIPKNIEWMKQTKWWTNETINKRSVECPGPEWRNGKIRKRKNQ